ncbi:hypothetical protein IGI37_000469 [Enterococcus sp. AZ194]|uniref:DUF2877 domain-containing protein n=1 Tax=Enterococcus sp. AZ194 TaxID=2774629 RepID=UPI003F26DBE4
MNHVVVSSYLKELTRFGRMGQVHSLFEHSLNLSFGERLINVTTASTFLSSFGLRISEEAFQRVRTVVKRGELVRLTEEKIVFYSQKSVQTISLAPFAVKDLLIPEIVYQEKRIEQLITYLTSLCLEDRLGIEGTKKEQSYVVSLVNNQQSQTIVPYFVGRGKGLTPSGDDLLLGYLFMLKLYAQPQTKFWKEEIQRVIHTTTSISANYFFALSEGFASSVFIELADYLKEPHSTKSLEQVIEAILSVGHTSGADMCYGLLIGAKTVQLVEGKQGNL